MCIKGRTCKWITRRSDCTALARFLWIVTKKILLVFWCGISKVTVSWFNLFNCSVIPYSLRIASKATEQQWNRDLGYHNNLSTAKYTNPFRSYNIYDGLRLKFSINDSNQFPEFKSNASSNVLVSLHAPDEVPAFNRHSKTFTLKSNRYTVVKITAHLVVSEGIEKYEPEVRQCYYSNERYLKFYKSYTQNHCERECLANYTLAKCGCTPYHLPCACSLKACSFRW